MSCILWIKNESPITKILIWDHEQWRLHLLVQSSVGLPESLFFGPKIWPLISWGWNLAAVNQITACCFLTGAFTTQDWPLPWKQVCTASSHTDDILTGCFWQAKQNLEQNTGFSLRLAERIERICPSTCLFCCSGTDAADCVFFLSMIAH